MHSVQVDWIYLKDRRVKRYYFERVSDCWYLEAINKEKLASASEGREDFFDFYNRFANDSVFQRERLHDPLGFVTVDPEDEFQILETTLDEGQWFSFRPPLLKERLTNVHYGQRRLRIQIERSLSSKDSVTDSAIHCTLNIVMESGC